MYEEINRIASELCESANLCLECVVSTKCECLPLLLGFMAESCFVKYDTEEEQITNIDIILIEKNGFVIEADPINACVRGYFADEICGSIQMRVPIAKTLRACIQACWKKRLSTEYLVTMNGDGRYIAADLFT